MFPVLKQIKKKLLGLTREHEALFNFVENNRQICTEKEKQKVQYMETNFHHNTFIIWECLLEKLPTRLQKVVFFFLFLTTDAEQAD